MITTLIIILAITIATLSFYYSNNTTERIIFIVVCALVVGAVFWAANLALDSQIEQRVALEVEKQRQLAIEVFGTDRGFNEAWRPQWAR